MTQHKAQVIQADGKVFDVEPNNSFAFTLEELQGFVEGNGSKTVGFVSFPDGRQLIVNDNGRLVGLPPNDKAMDLWAEQFPVDKYPHNNDGMVVGNVLVSTPEWVGVVDYDGRVITGRASSRRVFIGEYGNEDEQEIKPHRSLQLANHSPTGFMWGYAGSGPSQLALAILLELTDERTALAAYQQLKFDKIATLPQDKDLVIDVDEILEWLVEWRTAQK